MKGKIITGLIIFVLAFILVGCGDSGPYEIAFESNGGTAVNQLQVDDLEDISLLNEPTRDGYTFDGWYFDSALSEAFSLENVEDHLVENDLTLYAKWMALSTYTVAFDTKTETSIDSQEVMDGHLSTEPVEPVREGYTFDGWYLEDETFSFDEPIVENLLLEAHWSINTYKITYAQYGYEDESIEQLLLPGEHILQLEQGEYHSAILTSSGRLLMWGGNLYGQLGINSDTRIMNKPMEITSFLGLSDDEKIIEISLGLHHSSALTSNGRVFMWGLNNAGCIGDGTAVNVIVPKDITNQFNLENDEAIVHVRLGYGNSFAITSQNRLFQWGNYLDEDHTVKNRLTPTDITDTLSLDENEGIIDLVGGNSNTVLLTSNHRILIWGWNDRGQVLDGTRNNHSTAFDATDSFNLEEGEYILKVTEVASNAAAITSTGRVFTWGWNVNGELGDGTTIERTMPVDITSQFNLEEGEMIIDINIGVYFTSALSSSGRIFTWGWNRYQQLGDGTTLDSYVPIDVTDQFDLAVDEKIISLSSRASYSFVTTNKQNVYVWGRNTSGRLGIDTTDELVSPLKLSILEAKLIEENEVTYDFNEEIMSNSLEREGYTFSGWFIDGDLTKPFNDTHMPSGDVMLYGLWTMTEYDINYLNEDLSVFETNTYRYDSDLSDIESPVLSKDGYMFTGWYLDQDCTILFDLDTMPNADVTLYPHFVPSVFIYEYLSDSEIIITDYVGGRSDIEIPSMINGVAVTHIGDHAFRDKDLKTLVIPDSIVSIGDLAFANNFFDEITILGDVSRFNDVWLDIGFQRYLNPTYVDVSNFIFDKETGTIYDYRGTEKDIIIPNTIDGVAVTRIDDYAFSLLHLTSVSIPDTVTYIGYRAFAENLLTSVTLPEALTHIDAQAFIRNQITSITIPESVNYIGDYCFSVNGINEVNILGVQNRFNDVWEDIGFTFDLNQSVTFLNDIYFDETTGTILKYVGQDKDVIIPSIINGVTVTHIGGHAYQSLSLTSVSIPNSVTEIGAYAFSNNLLASLTLPESIVTIGPGAFATNVLTTLTIPDSVEMVGYCAFMYNEFTSITIPASVLEIGNGAFAWNDISNITILGDETRFSDVWEDLGFARELNPAYVIDQGYVFDPITHTIVDYIGSEVNLMIPSLINYIAVSKIGEAAFINCGLESVILPSSVTIIGEDAFRSNNLTSIVMPEGLVSIELAAFSGNLLTNITFNDSIEYIGAYAFSDNQLTSVDIPTTIDILTEGVFRYNMLTSIDIPDNILTIDPYAFYDNQLTSVDIPVTVEEIGHSAFSHNLLTSVVIPDTGLTIGDYAFAYNEFTSITLPEAMIVVPSGLFSNNKLETIAFSNDVISIGDFAFNGNLLTTIDLPDKVEYIGFGAFMHNNLESLVLPNSVIKIDMTAFANNSITSLTLPESIEFIGDDCFANNLVTEVHVLGDETRFNDDWEDIGLPIELMPTV